MFTLPSMWNIIIYTIVFIIAAWVIHRFLESQGIPKTMSRGLLVFILAYVVSWASGELVDSAHNKIYGETVASQQQTQLEQDLKQVLKDNGLKLP
jgi:predicted PurR-regulated permease PerM